MDEALAGSTPFMASGGAGELNADAAVRAAKRALQARAVAASRSSIALSSSTSFETIQEEGEEGDEMVSSPLSATTSSASFLSLSARPSLPRWSSMSKVHRRAREEARAAEPALPPWAGRKLVGMLRRCREGRRARGGGAIEEEGREEEEAEPARPSRSGLWPASLLDALFEAHTRGGPAAASSDPSRRRFVDAQRARVRGDPTTLDIGGAGAGEGLAAEAYARLHDPEGAPPGEGATAAALRAVEAGKNALGDAGAMWLMRLAVANHGVRRLGVAGNGLTPHGVAQLCRALPHTALESLDLSSATVQKNCAGRKGVEALADALAAPGCRLRELCLGSVCPAPFAALARGLEACATLEVLDARGNRLDDADVVQLCRALASSPSSLRRLTLAGNLVFEQGGAAVAALAAASPSLAYLNLTGCFVSSFRAAAAAAASSAASGDPSASVGAAGSLTGPALAASFCAKLRPALEDPACGLETLVLDECELRGQAVCTLAPAIALNASLRRLSAVSCSAGGDGMRALGEALAANGTLTDLNLRDNGIEDEGVRDLVRGLNHAAGSVSGLQFLNLAGNFVGDDGAEAAAAALRDNDSLQELSLQENSIHDRGARRLLECVTGAGPVAGAGRNRTLQVLNTRLNTFSRPLGVRLARALAENRESVFREELHNLRHEVVGLRDDERRLPEAQARLDEATEELVRTDDVWQRARSEVDAWKEAEVERTRQLSERLAEVTAEAEERVEALGSERRAADHAVKEAQFTFMEQSAAIRFRIANEKRKQYRGTEARQKAEHALAAREAELGATAEREREVEDELRREEEAAARVRAVLEAAAKKTRKATSQLMRSYCKAMAGYRAHELEARKAAGRPHTLRSWNWRSLDTRDFVRWMVETAEGGAAAAPATAAAAADAAPRRYISLNDVVRVRARLAAPGEVPEGAIVVQRSHSIQSLAMHGLEDGTTVWVSMLSEALARRELAGDAAPREAELEVTGGVTVPSLVVTAADALRVQPRTVRSLHYDPHETRRRREREAEEAAAAERRARAEASEARMAEDAAEEARRTVRMDTIRRDTNMFSSFRSTTVSALEDFDARLSRVLGGAVEDGDEDDDESNGGGWSDSTDEGDGNGDLAAAVAAAAGPRKRPISAATREAAARAMRTADAADDAGGGKRALYPWEVRERRAKEKEEQQQRKHSAAAAKPSSAARARGAPPLRRRMTAPVIRRSAPGTRGPNRRAVKVVGVVGGAGGEASEAPRPRRQQSAFVRAVEPPQAASTGAGANLDERSQRLLQGGPHAEPMHVAVIRPSVFSYPQPAAARARPSRRGTAPVRLAVAANPPGFQQQQQQQSSQPPPPRGMRRAAARVRRGRPPQHEHAWEESAAPALPGRANASPASPAPPGAPAREGSRRSLASVKSSVVEGGSAGGGEGGFSVRHALPRRFSRRGSSLREGLF